VSFRHPTEPLDGTVWYDGTVNQARNQVLHNIACVVQERRPWLLEGLTEAERPLDETVPGVGEPAKRGDYLLASLSLLLRSYPLGRKQFVKLSEVRPWLPTAENVVENVLKSLELYWSYAGLIVDVNATEKEQVRRGQATPKPASEAAVMEYLDAVQEPRRLLVGFRDRFREAGVELSAIRSMLDRYDDYRKRLPSPWTIAAIFVAVVLAFGTGVAVPLVEPTTSRWIYVDVPLGIYAFAMFVGLVLIVIYGRDRHDT